MNLGSMDRSIVIQSVTLAADTIGGQTETWSTFATVWAQVVPVSGSEAIRAGRQMATESARFFIHYLTGLTPKHRISYDSKTWDILNVREIGRREGLEILAEVRS